jgi:hypothetical protein
MRGGVWVCKWWGERNITLLDVDLVELIRTESLHSPVIISIQNLQGPALHGIHGTLATTRTSFRIAAWTDVQAIADAWGWILGWKWTTLAAKEANEDVGTTEIATKQGVALAVIDVVIEILYDMN